MRDLIIVGGGPAGLTAGIYALRKRLDVLLISKDLGGKTNFRMQFPNMDHHLVINGEEIVSRFVNEMEYLDFARVMDTAERVEKIEGGYRVNLSRGEQHEARALIVATGAAGQRLNVPGEKEFLMRGLSYSALSYAPLFIDREAVVIGDTGLALRATAELAQIARHVTLVAPSRGDLDSPLGRRLQVNPQVLILEGYRVVEVKGDTFARALVVDKDGQRHEVPADVFFVELDLVPNVGFVAGLVERDARGRIRIDERNRTSAPGLFAAGDVTDAYAEQVLIAIGEGAKAALSAYEYLLEQPVPEAAPAGEWR